MVDQVQNIKESFLILLLLATEPSLHHSSPKPTILTSQSPIREEQFATLAIIPLPLVPL